MSVGSGYLESFFKDKSVFKGESPRDSPSYKIYNRWAFPRNKGVVEIHLSLKYTKGWIPKISKVSFLSLNCRFWVKITKLTGIEGCYFVIFKVQIIMILSRSK